MNKTDKNGQKQTRNDRNRQEMTETGKKRLKQTSQLRTVKNRQKR